MPPPPQPSARATRSLRSQSKETELHGEIARRGTRPDPRGRSVGSVTSTKGTGTEIDFSEFAETQTHNLSTVHEVGGETIQVQYETVSPRPRSSVARSDINDTPGKKLARAKLMRTFLPRLFHASDEVQSHLLLPDHDEDWEVRLEVYAPVFTAYQSRYADSDSFISERYVLSQIDEPEGSAGRIYASRVVAAANIAALLLDLFETDEENVLNFLQRIDQIFPMYFFPEQEPGREEWMTNHDTFDLALAVRTQLLIATLHRFQEFHGEQYDPLLLATNIFVSDSVNNIFISGSVNPEEVRQALSENDDGSLHFRSLAGVDLNSNLESDERAWLRRRYRAQFKALFDALSQENSGSALAQLDQDFPFAEFSRDLKAWAHACFHELKAHLQPRQASEGIAESQYDSQGVSQPIIRAVPSSSAPAVRLSQIQLLKRMENELASASGSARKDQVVTDDEVLRRRQEIQSSPYAASETTNGRAQNYPSPTPEGGHSGIGRLYAATVAMAGAKRHRAGEGEDDFEIDTRVPDSERRLPDENSSKRAQYYGPEHGSIPAPSMSMVSGSPGPLHPNEDVPIKDQPSSQLYPDISALSQRARQVSMVNRKSRGPQTRTFWSSEDCQMLIQAIDTYKCKWSVIEKEIRNGVIPFHHPRDQQALRDKARLLKVDFLKADGVLPPGFDLVVLGKKERQAVIACGKNPDRLESDLDEDNRPTNTVYLG
ncbi:hypothetical protein VTK73DRAFT_1805 [Phialemonium thermophilum]|uniref:Myb-like domain-containing protein n=1 Tax=Phialemonium thermophilum TaxID=223376 RepID=A0ABR3X7Q0_9PEZI